MNTKALVALILLSFSGLLAAEAPKAMPKQDVVEFPAMRAGLCVSNLFQTHMVLQRDQPLKVWGWAAPGEQITVSFAGQQVSATAAAVTPGIRRAWPSVHSSRSRDLSAGQ